MQFNLIAIYLHLNILGIQALGIRIPFKFICLCFTAAENFFAGILDKGKKSHNYLQLLSFD